MIGAKEEADIREVVLGVVPSQEVDDAYTDPRDHAASRHVANAVSEELHTGLAAVVVVLVEMRLLESGAGCSKGVDRT
jgi:hypothetical protein